MSYTRQQRFEPGAFLRPCDICGIRFRSTELARGEDGFWRCRRWCHEVPQITRDKISAASQRRKEAPPPKFGVPYDQKDAYAEEADAFDFLVTMPVPDPGWPGGVRSGAAPSEVFVANGGAPIRDATQNYTYTAAYETCRYLYQLITDGSRPAAWVTPAKVKLREQADWLLGKQNTTGTPDTNLIYGGWDGSLLFGGNGNLVCADQSGGGLACLWAYLVLGDFKYLAGARAAANAVRVFQWSGNARVVHTSSDSAGTSILYCGAHCKSMTQFSGTWLFDHLYYASDLSAVEFLSLLKATDGDGNYGGIGNDGVGAQWFLVTAAATLSSMIADALAFWPVGLRDAVTGGVTTGLSATTPREFFNAFPAAKGNAAFPTGTGAWEYNDGPSATGTNITGTRIALALRSLYAVSGYNGQVASVWTWLMGFGSNATFAGPAETLAIDFPVASTKLSANPPAPPTGQGNIIQPSYRPKLALVATLTVRDASLAPTAINGSSTYDWSTSGLMAAIQTSQDAGSLRKAKDTIVAGRLRTQVPFAYGDAPIQETLLMRGQSGLAFQTNFFTIGSTIRWQTSVMARTAAVMRYAPKATAGDGRPDKSQPGGRPGTMQVQT